MAPLSQFVEVVLCETTAAGAITTGAGSTTGAAGTSTAGGNAATESTSFVLVKQPETIPLTAMTIANEDSFKLYEPMILTCFIGMPAQSPCHRGRSVNCSKLTHWFES
jgi:hypothetical protein